MREFVLRENLARFRKLIAETPDPAQRRALERLLEEAQTELAGLGSTQDDDPVRKSNEPRPSTEDEPMA